MTELTIRDLDSVVSRLPKDLMGAMECSSLIIGGGFIRSVIAGEVPNDIDIFASTVDELKNRSEGFVRSREAKMITTENAYSVVKHGTLTLQFITRWIYDDPISVMDSFDFTVCQAVIWYDRSSNLWKSQCSYSFYPDLAARRIVYTCPQRNEDAGGSMLRVIKYVKKGYNIQVDSLGKIIARLVMGVNEIHSGVIGEEHLGVVLIGLLREVDPTNAANKEGGDI